MTPHEETRVAQMQGAYELNITELEQKLDVVCVDRARDALDGQATMDEANNEIVRLQAELKAAEDHAATMEGCAKVAESELLMVRLANIDCKRELAKSVPFEKIRIACSCFSGEPALTCFNGTVEQGTLCTKDNCPLIPKEALDNNTIKCDPTTWGDTSGYKL